MSKKSNPARKFITFTVPADDHKKIKAQAAMIEITIPEWCEAMALAALSTKGNR